MILVHSLEQPVKSQNEEDQDGAGEQVSDDAETEERLVRGNVVDCCRRVPTHEQGGRNIDEAEGGCDDKEQVQKSGDSPWVFRHMPSLVKVIRE